MDEIQAEATIRAAKSELQQGKLDPAEDFDEDYDSDLENQP